MEIDRATLKAVSAGTRMKMLQSLARQKKMPSELSRETGLSPSTVVEHLQNLEAAGLVTRIETGHKWVYYAPTDKGMNLVQPRTPVQLMLTFVMGLLMISFGFLKSMSSGIAALGTQKSAVPEVMKQIPLEATQDSGALVTSVPASASQGAVTSGASQAVSESASNAATNVTSSNISNVANNLTNWTQSKVATDMEYIAQSPSQDWIYILILAAGLIIAVFSLYKIYKAMKKV